MIELNNQEFMIMLLMPILTLWFGFGFAVWAERHRLKKKGIQLDKFWSIDKK